MITRGFKLTRVNVLCMDIEKAEPFNKDVLIPRMVTDNKKLRKLVDEIVNTDTIKTVHIVDVQTECRLYGMTESDFIKYATELDENRKPIVTEVKPETDAE